MLDFKYKLDFEKFQKEKGTFDAGFFVTYTIVPFYSEFIVSVDSYKNPEHSETEELFYLNCTSYKAHTSLRNPFVFDPVCQNSIFLKLFRSKKHHIFILP